MVFQEANNLRTLSKITGKKNTMIPELSTLKILLLALHCHAIKKNNSKTIQWIKLRNCDVIDREDTSPSFKPLYFPKLQKFEETFCTNL